MPSEEYFPLLEETPALTEDEMKVLNERPKSQWSPKEKAGAFNFMQERVKEIASQEIFPREGVGRRVFGC